MKQTSIIWQQSNSNLKSYKKTVSGHKWTDDNIKDLHNAVLDSLPMLDHYLDRGYSKTAWWNVVAGIFYLRTGIKITGKACYTKYREVNSNYKNYAHILQDYKTDINLNTNTNELDNKMLTKAIKLLFQKLGLDYNKFISTF